MRPLIDDTRLLEKIKQATTKEDLTNQNQTGRTTSTTTTKCSLKALISIKKTNKKHLNSFRK